MIRGNNQEIMNSHKHLKMSNLNNFSESVNDEISANMSSNHSTHRKPHSRHHRHSTTSKHLSPKGMRHKPTKSGSYSYNNRSKNSNDSNMCDPGKGSPPPKLLKMSHQHRNSYNNDDGIDSTGSSSPGDQDNGQKIFSRGNSAASLRSMNNSDCSTSPESLSCKNDSNRRYSKGSSGSTSGIGSMSSGASDSSPSSFFYGDKERERSYGESTDPGSNGSSPMPSVQSNSLQASFQSSLSTVHEFKNEVQHDVGHSHFKGDQKNLGQMQAHDKSCLVCGDKATGYHFNALTCEGCKGFFRRNSQKLDELKCSFSSNCKITKVTRRHCQSCRLNKCFKVGMLTECIMTEEQKVVRKMKNTDKHQAAQQEANNVNYAPNTLLTSPSISADNKYSPMLSPSQHRSRSNSVSVSDGGFNMQQTQGGCQLGSYMPPNQEQLALMEELSIEYHNLYSKRATVEDVISNVPARPKTMDSPSPFVGAHDSMANPGMNPDSNHQNFSMFGHQQQNSMCTSPNIEQPLTIINPPQQPLPLSPDDNYPNNPNHQQNISASNHHNLLMPAPPTRPQTQQTPDNMQPHHSSHQQNQGVSAPPARKMGLGGDPGLVPEAELSKMCKYLAAITSNRLERCVAFCQRMPGFQLLSLSDKMSLLKSGAFEILLLRSSIFMDSSMDKIKAGSFTLTPEMLMRIPYLRPFVCPFFLFISKFKSLNCDLTELLLLIGVVLFSPDRPGVQNKEAISNIQQVYADTLQAYLSTKYCQAFLENQQMENSRALSESIGQNMPLIKNETPSPRVTCGASTILESALVSPNGNSANQNQAPKLSKLTAALISPTGVAMGTGSSGIAGRAPSASAMMTRSRTRLGSLMMQVCSLRSVNFEHSQSILKIDVKRKEDIGPFLREMLVASNPAAIESPATSLENSVVSTGNNQYNANENEQVTEEDNVTLTVL